MLACPSSVNSILENKTTEVMTLPLDDNNGHISRYSVDKILEQVEKSDAVLIGPGLGRSDDAKEVVKTLLKSCNVPVVVDADAIFAISEDKSFLHSCACDLIFTPHAMEMSRLTGLDVSYIEDNRIQVSREFCEEIGAVLLLKGHHSLVTAPSL